MVIWKTPVAALAGIASLVSASTYKRDDAAPAIEQTTVPGAYIVELADDQDAAGLVASLQTEAGLAKVSQRLDFKSKVFKGVSISVENSNDETARKIAALPHVKQLWPVPLISVPKLNFTVLGNDGSASKHRRQTNSTDSWPPHVMTQVDKLRAKGFTGKGLRIGIVDTGIDYKHPALGGCFGPGCLVEYGYDLVGDAYDGTSAPVPDDDPFEECEGHGTHVAGIIAAQENPRGFTGASPGVKLGMYRTFGCTGQTTGDILLAGVIKAFEDGSDIITGSIGGPSGWAGDAFALAVARIVDAGVPCTFAAGNEVGGTEGLFGISSPSTGDGVISVSSYQNQDADGAGQVSAFTSWGPTFELNLAPSFGAPGGGIPSTFPVALGSYALASGTSMATPLVASIVALIIQARDTRDPDLIKRLLASTAKPNFSQNYGDPNIGAGLGPVPQQGAGIVQAYDAAYATTVLSVAGISFNDTDNLASEVSFTVTNVGDTPATYNVSHVPALTALTLYQIYRDSSPILETVYASLTFEPSSFTVEPNATAEVRVSVIPPKGLDTPSLPVYSGWVALNGTNGDGGIALSVPYIGVAGSMKNVTVLASQRIFLTRSDDPRNPTVAANTTFQLPTPADHADWAQPLLNTTDLILPVGALPDQYVWLVMGSAEVRIEVVPLDANPDAKDNGLGVSTLGNIAGYPVIYRRPIGWMNPWDGTLANGSRVPPGRYSLAIFALKIAADRSLVESWDRYNSPEIIIRYV
ncbi:subtilisin-like serine protease pr1c [Colletotrichum truncatum]|uniref:Subtilisin-like serine protease pr1c n=1 Tax=Colletotrichum truncatum TaxID=5467 RepID=A0ACC3YNL9_COLTU|nr:subtilisin-like serine protease pr1c [Colletotrichum truncatum]KAF6789444.1 subtilisin-like serine protease pr1c [Colletotrichum truncatum]